MLIHGWEARDVPDEDILDLVLRLESPFAEARQRARAALPVLT